MLQNYLLPFIILCCLNFVSCQWKSYDLPTTTPSLPLTPYLQAGKYGYMDASGRLYIAAQYDEVKLFDKNGVAAVRKGEQWWLLTCWGKELFPVSSSASQNKDSGHLGQIDDLPPFFIYYLENKPHIYARFHLVNVRKGSFTPVYQYIAPAYAIRSGIYHPFTPYKMYEDILVLRKDSIHQDLLNQDFEVVLADVTHIDSLEKNVLSLRKDGILCLFDIPTRTTLPLPYQKITYLQPGIYCASTQATPQLADFWDLTAFTTYIDDDFPHCKRIINRKGEILLDSLYYKYIYPFGARYFQGKNAAGQVEIFDIQGNIINCETFTDIIYNNYDDSIKNSTTFTAVLPNKKYILINEKTERLLPDEFDRLEFDDQNAYYTCQKGKTVCLLNSDLTEIVSYSSDENIQPYFQNDVMSKDYFIITEKGKKGLIDCNGIVRIPPVYKDVAFFFQSNACLYITCLSNKDRYGIWSNDTVRNLDTVYTAIYLYQHQGEEYFLVSSQLEEPLLYEWRIAKNNKTLMERQSENLSKSFKKAPYFQSGVSIAPYYDILEYFDEGYFVAQPRPDQTQEYLILDKKGNIVFQFDTQWKNIKIVETSTCDSGDSTFIAQRYDPLTQQYKTYWIDERGKILLEGGGYDEIHTISISEEPFDEEHIILRGINKQPDGNIINDWINCKGAVLFSNQYRDMKELPSYSQVALIKGKEAKYIGYKTLASFKTIHEIDILDSKGKILWDTEYHRIEGVYHGKYWVVSKGGFWGLADENGKLIIPLNYTYLENANNSNLWYASSYPEKARYLLNQYGEIIMKNWTETPYIHTISEKYVAVSIAGKSLIFNQEGKCVKEIKGTEIHNPHLQDEAAENGGHLKFKDENNKIFYINKTTLQEYRDTSF
ncbi:MAG: WG repeat-containing protein [Sphingobacteriales bacterium]|nr:WG repeat-containing protein [Sphingobacteriales bacterium]